MAGLSVSPVGGHTIPTRRVRGKTRLEPIPEDEEMRGEDPMEVIREQIAEPELNPEDLIPDTEADPGYVPRVRHKRLADGPSEGEKFEHNITHIPYKPWCSICVSARGRNDPHRATKLTYTVAPCDCF